MNTGIRQRVRALRAGTSSEAGESGFTLIELMVVVLIIAILMAIAIPTFLGTKKTAQDNGAQQDITNVSIDAQALFAQTQDYSTVCGTANANLIAAEKNITVEPQGTNALSKNNQVEAGCSAAGNDTAILLVSQSPDGDCWMEWVDANNGTQFGIDKTEKGTTAACPATDLVAATAGATPAPTGANITWAAAWNDLTS